MDKLTTGDQFPDITLNIAGGRTINIPADLEAPRTILLFYRGFW